MTLRRWAQTFKGGSRLRHAALAVFTLGSLLLPAADADAWWSTAWQVRRKLTFNNAGQPSNLANFPVLVVLTNGVNIDYTKTQNSGQDLKFVDANDSTVLQHEIELWNEGGTSYVWVKVPQIDASSTTDFIWMYYDNPTAAAPTPAFQQATWDGHFRMVQHLNETAGAHTDSTATGNHSNLISVTQQGTAAGQIDGADEFVLASLDRVRVPDAPTLDTGATESLLVEAWVTPVNTATYQHIVSKELASPPVVGEGGFEFSIPDTRVRFFVTDGTATCNATTGSVISAATTYYLVGRYDRATGDCQVFVNGSFSVGATTGMGSLANPQPLGIGREEDVEAQGYEFNGVIDEVRVSIWPQADDRRPDDWISAQYESMRSGSTFISYSAEIQVKLRSIGTAANTTGGNVTASTTSRIVNGVGTSFLTANRGRGDRITINGNSYTIASVQSNTQLTLTSFPIANFGPGPTYSIQRKFNTLADWEECIDGGVPGPGPICEAPPSASLVADNREEIGIAYDDSAVPANPDFTAIVLIDGSTTDAGHTITLTADGPNRHYGLPGTGVLVATGGSPVISIEDDYVTVEWLEIDLTGGSGGIRARNISLAGANYLVIRNNLIHSNLAGQGIVLEDGDEVADVYNNIVYRTGNAIRVVSPTLNAGARIRIMNNTMYDYDQGGFDSSVTTNPDRVTLINNLAADADFGDNGFALQGLVNAASRNNLSARSTSDDPTAGIGANPPYFASPGGGGVTNLNAAAVQFVNAAAGNLHIQATSAAANTGADLSALFVNDIDHGARRTLWDIGADDVLATTEVVLQSLGAVAGDASVVVEWRTASELRNLGFHLYRALGENGPWTRLTTSLIPGLGSSAVGQVYSFRDSGLVNGTRYFYRLEDVDASSKTTSHGPVSAVPQAGAGKGSEPSGSNKNDKNKASASSCPDWVLAAYGSATGSDPSTLSLSCTRHGNPEAVSLGELSRDARSATLELRTGGFYALHEPEGTVRVFVPGFDFPQDDKAAALPIRRILADAVVGRRVQLGGVRALELQSVALQPAALGKAEMQVGRDGTVRALRRAAARQPKRFPKAELATLLPSLFQGEKKSAAIEIAPLRFDEQRRQLVLAKRVLVRLLFTGREAGESGRGNVGRAPGRKPVLSGEVLARLFTTSRGVYAVSFEQLFPGRSRGFASSELNLQRQGEAVAFHVEPAGSAFGPGGRLYFHADRTTSSTDYSGELAWELVHAQGGVQMALQGAAPGSAAVTADSVVTRAFETNRLYQPGLLEAQDQWLWEAAVSGATRVKSFSLAGVSTSGTATLDVHLQGASESGQAVDHHVSVSLNGTFVGETRFAGKKPHRMSLSLEASLLREGTNDLMLRNVGDTGITSVVFLDRFTLTHPQPSSLAGGVFEGSWSESGSATVGGVSAGAAVVDVTAAARWLTGYEATGGSVRFRVEAGHRYLVASQPLAPRVTLPEPSTLRAATNQADYVLIAPQAFLEAAQPLLDRRQDQGLSTRAASLEEIAAEFGHGQASAEAIKSFLAHAFHSWSRPSPRYVVLLGDANYDPRNFIGTSQPSPLPALWTKTTYLWTAADPLLAAVNGTDNLPDLAIGRLPATTVEQAQALVAKLLAWEDSGQGLGGAAALVADNPDIAGDFEADVEDIRASYLGSRQTTVLKLSELGAQTRPAILDALNSGLSYLNYVGHGGSAVWASENVWSSSDAPSLQAQSQQPLLVTMNCLNGYFVAPTFESLSESLMKAEGRGAIASFSPSGLSLDAPAHQYHRALMAELTSGRHARLGDATLAAQKAYAETGLMPELVSVYHLLGDPATRIGN